ncbi:MAG: hypothetical protein PHF84_07215, partial [bacterium]|nr:hypothetical protein [bacterium]
MKRVFCIIIFLLIILPGFSGLFAERAMYLWGMAYQLTRYESERSEFYSFIRAPKGRSENEIGKLYFNGYEALNGEQAALRLFLADMHSRGLKIYCLGGDPLWASPLLRVNGEAFCRNVLDFNEAGSEEERFDGVIFDVEPYGLGDWQTNNRSIWTNYLLLLKNCKAMVETYNISNSSSLEFGDSIPVWYDEDSSTNTNPRKVQTNTHFVVLMDYTDNSNQMIWRATNECRNGVSLGRKVSVAAETYSIVAGSETFWQEGNSYMEQVFKAVSNSSTGLGRFSSFKGFTVHFYEDVSSENAYRNLDPLSPNSHINAPVAFLTSPNGREGLSYSSNIVITWNTVDPDADTLSIHLLYSSNNGTNWNDLPGVDKEGNSRDVNDGRYVWDLAAAAEGERYRIKIKVWDSTFTNFDVSDYKLRITKTAVQNTNHWSGTNSLGNAGCKPQIIFDDQDPSILHSVFYDAWAPIGLYYKKSTDMGVSWDSLITISDSTGPPKKPSMAVRNNKVAVVYLKGADYAEPLYIRISTNGGGSFASEYRIDNSSGNEKNFPDIAIDSAGNLHVVWMENTGSRVIKYRMQTNHRNWGSIRDLDTYAYIFKHPAICVDQADNLHVVYDRRNWFGNKGIRYCKKTNGIWTSSSDIWTASQKNDSENIMAPDITENGNIVHVVWQTSGTNPLKANTNSHILYLRKTNTPSGTWSSSVTIGTGYVPCVAGYGNDLHIVWYDARNEAYGQIKYRYSRNNGASFSNSDLIIDNSDVPYWAGLGETYELVNPYVSIPYVAVSKEKDTVITWREYSSAAIKYVFKFNTIKLEVPRNLSLNLVTGDRTALKLKWEPPSTYYPNKYRVYRATNFSADYDLITGSVYGLEYLDTGLLTNRQYKYKVQAVL